MANKYIDKSIEVTEEILFKGEIGKIEQETSDSRKTLHISVVDFVNMAIGYTTAQHLPIVLGKENNVGKCLICGIGTNAVERCICYDCHGKHIKEMYFQFIEQKNTLSKGFDYKY